MSELETIDRLARIETQLETLPAIKEYLEEAVEELRKRDDELGKEITDQRLVCVARVSAESYAAKKVDELEKRVKPIEEILPALKKVAEMYPKLYIIAAAGGGGGIANRGAGVVDRDRRGEAGVPVKITTETQSIQRKTNINLEKKD